jgi:hypothetical protein
MSELSPRHTSYIARIMHDGTPENEDYCQKCGTAWPCQVEQRDRVIDRLKAKHPAYHITLDITVNDQYTTAPMELLVHDSDNIHIMLPIVSTFTPEKPGLFLHPSLGVIKG